MVKKKIHIPKTYGSSMIPVRPDLEDRDPVFKTLATATKVFAGLENTDKRKKRK